MVLNVELPDVRKTAQDIQEFDDRRIIESLMKEANLDRVTATKVANVVTRKIYSSQISWLSGPLIREICCATLAQMGLDEARRDYTRIGLPIYDYDEYLRHGYKENANQYRNPESVHAWVADRVTIEYSLLKLLPDDLARFHFEGWGHIHKLKYFPLRPFCAGWDARMIGHLGLPPGGSAHSAASGPAKHPLVFMLHLAKWMGIIQGSFQGGQGYDHFTAFCAPYFKGLSDKELDQMAQCFIFESNQIYAARGAQVPFTSMHCSPEIPKAIVNVPAVSLGGEINGIYGDYQDECKRFFDAICRVEMKGDRDGKLFNFPKHEVEVRKEWLEKHEDSYMLVHEEAAKMGTPYFILYPDWMPDDASCQCCRIIFTKDGIKRFCKDKKKFEWEHSYMNIGSLQTVSINLPRIAYEANGNDDLLYEILDQQLERARDILLIKKSLVEQTYMDDPLLNKVIPFPGGDPQPIFDLDRYSLTFGHVGLNEMIAAHTGLELHESADSLQLGVNVIDHIKKRLDEYAIDHQYNFTLWEQPAESAAGRFARKDAKRYPNAIYNGEKESAYYTNSNHIRYDAQVPLYEVIEKQALFHPIVQGGVITHAWLGEGHPDASALFALTKKIMAHTPTAYMAFTLDFTQCLDCQKFTAGALETCPHCHSTNLEWWSRVTGYYSRVNQYSDNKKREWLDRHRKTL